MNERLNMAINFRQAGHYDEAKELLTSLLKDRPNDALVHYHYAWLHDAMGEETSAIPHYEQAIALGLSGDDLRGALLGLGSTYRTVGQYEKAVETLRRGAATFPDAKAFPVFLAMALYNIGGCKEAVSLLLNTLVDSTGDPDILRYQRAISLYASDLDQTWR